MVFAHDDVVVESEQLCGYFEGEISCANLSRKYTALVTSGPGNGNMHAPPPRTPGSWPGLSLSDPQTGQRAFPSHVEFGYV